MFRNSPEMPLFCRPKIIAGELVAGAALLAAGVFIQHGTITEAMAPEEAPNACEDSPLPEDLALGVEDSYFFWHQRGLDTSEIEVVFVPESEAVDDCVVSATGIRASNGPMASPANGTIAMIDTPSIHMSIDGAPEAILAHEYAHFSQAQDRETATAPEMIAELQADCYAGAYMQEMRPGTDVRPVAELFASLGDDHADPEDVIDDPHGDSRQRRAAFYRGHNTGSCELADIVDIFAQG